jgi:sulfite reductase (ferredoxin)
MAELGLVGDGPNSYQIWLGGSLNATRLAETFADRVKVKVRTVGWVAGWLAGWLAGRKLGG